MAFCAWSVVVIGVLVALASAGGASRYGGAGAGFFAMAPGIAIGVAGLLLVAFVQMGRATVDTAEYSQQMLQVSRDQLQVSRQIEKQNKIFQLSYADQRPNLAAMDTTKGSQKKTEGAEKPETSYATPANPKGRIFHYKSQDIVEINGIYHLDGLTFEELWMAKKHINKTSDTNLISEDPRQLQPQKY